MAFFACKVRGFESEDELLEAYKASTTRDLLGAVVFSKTGDEFEVNFSNYFS